MSGSNDFNLIVWNITSGRPYRSWFVKKKPVSTLLKLENGNIISTSYLDKYIYVWNKENETHINKILAHERGINQIVMFKKFLISGSFDSRIKLWDINSLNYINAFDIEYEVLNLVKFSSNSFLSLTVNSSLDIRFINENNNNVSISKGEFNISTSYDVETFALLEENKLVISSSNQIDILQFSKRSSSRFLDSIVRPFMNCTKEISALAVLKNNIMIYGFIDGIINKIDFKDKNSNI